MLALYTGARSEAILSLNFHKSTSIAV